MYYSSTFNACLLTMDQKFENIHQWRYILASIACPIRFFWMKYVCLPSVMLFHRLNWKCAVSVFDKNSAVLLCGDFVRVLRVSCVHKSELYLVMDNLLVMIKKNDHNMSIRTMYACCQWLAIINYLSYINSLLDANGFLAD